MREIVILRQTKRNGDVGAKEGREKDRRENSRRKKIKIMDTKE